jgi:phage gpG-like protein
MARKSTATVYVKIYGDDEVRDYMDAIERRSKNLKPVFHWTKRELEKANSKNFLSNGLPVGGWKPLSAAYGAWKTSRFPGQPTMIRSGKLFRSLTDINSNDIEINDTNASFSSSIEYAKFHQYGTSKMPARKIIYEPAGFARKFGQKVAEHVVDKRVFAESRRLMN